MEPDDKPKGTMAILLIFLVVLIISWGAMYLLMLQRSGG